MNNLRKTAVFLFIGVFILSMVFVPFTPTANVESQVAAPIDYEREFVEKWADRLQNDLGPERMDSVLASYLETGELDENIVTTRDGDVKLLIYVAPTFDFSTIADIAKVNWKLDLSLITMASVDISSVVALRQLEAMDGIDYIQADQVIHPDPITDSMDDIDLEMFKINDLTGATVARATYGYDGTGVVVGVVDSGVDFSQEDMRNAEYNNGTYPMSYDPSSMGLTEMVIANNTFVENTTAWLEAGNLLTYEMGGKYYLDVTGWDPVCNNEGGHRSLMGLAPPYGDGYPYGSNVGYIGLYEWAWGGNNVSEFVYNEMWNDWEIPTPTADNYTFGWAYQQKIDGYAKVFAPSMIYDGNLIIDWNGSIAWSRMWNWAIRSQVSAAYATWEIDLNTTADRDLITGMMDWSFVDDYDEGYIFNAANNVLIADIDDDGHMDGALGSLSWAYDDLAYLSFDAGLFFGITDDGMAWNSMFTTDTDHGHWTASAIASAGTFDHDVFGNGTTYNLPGIAPGAKIIASKGITSAGSLASQVWAMGFTLNETSGYWEYIGDGPSHHADLVSNSWGWGPAGMYIQLRIHAMVVDLASVPGILAPSYPGTLMVFSAGNEGVDYGTAGTPGAAWSTISVGASMVNTLYETLYSPYQDAHGQQAPFSSMGPSYLGYTKPDIMAPGIFGASPTPSENDWMYGGDTYTWWSGTSLACPVVAGVAALVMEAAGDNDPQMTKNILLSSATDMGFDPMVQGHGFVNAEAAIAAIDSVDGNSYIFESESTENWADAYADAWGYWVPYWAPWGDIYYEDWFDPAGLESSSIYYGIVERGETKTVTLNIEDYGGAGANIADFDLAPQPWYYTEGSKIEFSLTGYQYNDTNFSPVILRDGFWDLTGNMTTGEETAFWLANYVTVYITMDAADMGLDARIVDWEDTIANGDLNYWNYTTDVGDVVSLVARSGGPNILTMRLASPGTMADIFQYAPTLMLFDAAGVTVDVTMELWTKTPDSDVVITNDGTTGVNATLTVDADAEYGVHYGSISFVDGAFMHEVPYSYTVEAYLNGAEGDVFTLVDGAGPETTPYDTGLATTFFTPGTDSTQEGGGITSFHIDVPYDITLNATILVMRAKWQNPGTVVDFYLRDETGGTIYGTDDGGRPFDPQPTDTLANTIIWDAGELINGTYWFEYYIHVFDGATVPEPITIEFQLYNATSLAPAVEAPTYTTNAMGTPTAFGVGATLTGDHVVIDNVWSIPATVGLPEYSTITNSRLSLLSGLYVELDGIYADPQGFDAWPVPLANEGTYNWETVDGINAGDNVAVAIDSQGGADPAIQVYTWDDANDDDIVSLDEIGPNALLDRDQGTTGDGEGGSFVATESGSLAILVFNFAYVYAPGVPYTVSVDTRVEVAIENESGVPEHVEFDTYLLYRNISIDVVFTAWTTTDIVWEVNMGTCTFNNYFLPVVTVNEPIVLANNQFNFTWSSTDVNMYDTHYYSVWLSADAGVSYQLLRRNMTATFFVWDSSGYSILDDYIVRIRAFSVDLTTVVDIGDTDPLLWPAESGVSEATYWPGDYSDGFSGTFTAGDVPLPTPTPTPTTTPTPTPTPTPTSPPPIDPLLIGLIGGIGVGVVVLLILFLIRKK